MFNLNSLKLVVLNSIKAFFVSLFFGTAAQAASVEPMKILFIGNSYTHMNEMPKLLQKMADKAGKDVIIERNTQSGGSFEIHSQREDMYQAINRRAWDYVILQGYSRELSHSAEHIDSNTVPYLNQITDSVYANNSCTNIMFYMTWGYESGYLDREEVNSFDKMTDSIAKGYTYLGELFKVPVVPVGLVWRQVRKSSSIDLYAPDRAHPSKNGSYLIASTFYNAIFGESNDNVYTSSITSENAEIIKKEAKNFIASNREKYNLQSNRFLIASRVTEKGEFELDFSTSFNDSIVLTWFFGDGNTADTTNGVHTYKKAGTYTVRLLVEDECGTRSHERIVEFLKPEKPSKRRRRKPKFNAKNKKKV